MTEYRIIKRSIGFGHNWDDEYHKYFAYIYFKSLGTQGELFNEPKTTWKFLFYSQDEDRGWPNPNKISEKDILEQLAKKGFSAKDTITGELNDSLCFGSIEYKNFRPSEGHYPREEYLEKLVKEHILKNK